MVQLTNGRLFECLTFSATVAIIYIINKFKSHIKIDFNWYLWQVFISIILTAAF